MVGWKSKSQLSRELREVQKRYRESLLIIEKLKKQNALLKSFVRKLSKQ